VLCFDIAAAYFWGGQTGETPDAAGVLIPDENGGLLLLFALLHVCCRLYTGWPKNVSHHQQSLLNRMKIRL